MGVPCRYDGSAGTSDKCVTEFTRTQLLKVCPEILGGLETPRSPAEIQKNKLIMTKDNVDVTKPYQKGAEKTLELSIEHNVKYAVLKARSPSCGSCQIYDGSFNGRLIEGTGVCAKLLMDNNIEVYNEENAPYKKLKVYDFLDSHNIPYKKYSHQPVYTVDDAKALEIFIEGTHCKNLFLRNGKGDKHYLAILEQHEKISLNELAKVVGEKKLSFASEERLSTYLGIEAGSVGVFGLLNDYDNEVEVILGKDIKNHPEITFHPNENNETLGISYENFEKILKILEKKLKIVL